ncbi:MAG: hypothetical protein ABID84_04090 [Chloroflexota bacterium]
MAEDVTQTVEAEPVERTEKSIPAGGGPAEVSLEDRIVELEATLAERDARIQGLVDAQAQYEQRIAALEEHLAQRDACIGEMEAALNEAESALKGRESELEAVRTQLAQAVALYRSALLAAELEIPEEMVQGTTVEEIEASLARARQMVEQVRSQLEAQAAQERVPFGAPVRSAPDLSGLSPQEKILLGLSRK